MGFGKEMATRLSLQMIQLRLWQSNKVFKFKPEPAKLNKACLRIDQDKNFNILNCVNGFGAHMKLAFLSCFLAAL